VCAGPIARPGLDAAGSLLAAGGAGRGLHGSVAMSAETQAHSPPHLPLEGLDSWCLFNTFSSIHFDII